ncbi:MAG: tandem-95 repeat protein [Planctomycetales bacterium]|nr:tandem-95 repeat protein [Planctomycetales bacterium]
MFKSRSSKKRRSKNNQIKRRSLTTAERLEARDLMSAVSWSAGPNLPEPRTDAAAVVTSNGTVRLLGGSAGASTDSPVLVPNAAAWSLGVAIDTQRTDLGAVSSGNSVYLFGGTANGEGSDEVLNYDYALGDSQDLSKMNTIRFDHGYAAASGQVYALGGIGVQADGEVWADAERYNPSTDTWSSIAALPQGLHGLSAIGDGNGHLFVFGGSTTIDDTGIQRNSYQYDIATDAWSSIAPIPTGTRDSAVAVDDDGLIYLIGGMTTAGATDAVQVYDPGINAWTSETPLPAAVYSHAAAFDGAHIVVAGGFDASGVATDAVYLTQDLTVADVAPVISSSPFLNGSLDKLYTYDVNAIGNPDPTYTLQTSPAGMTIDPTTGVISWQPVAGQVGVHSVVVEASNRAGAVQQAFDISVVADTIAPTAPANFAFDSATQTTLTFNWEPSFDASGIDHYEVATASYGGPRFGKRWSYTVVDTLPSTATSYTATGLAPLSGNTYAVRAVDVEGLVSGWSTRASGQTLASPTITYRFNNVVEAPVQSPALTTLQLTLSSTGNPTPTYSLESGPATMTVDATTGLVQWTPDVADVGIQNVTFRATNTEGFADIVVPIEVTSDAPQLSVQYGPSGGVIQAGTLFTAQVVDSSNTPSTYSLVSAPDGMTMDGATGSIAWTPTGAQGGVNMITVRGENAGGTADTSFGVVVQFTGAVTGVTLSDLDLLEPTVSWTAPIGEGADLVDSYHIAGFAEWGVGRTYSTHRVSYDVPASETSVLLTGLLQRKSYQLTITPIDAAGNAGVANVDASFLHAPALPIVTYDFNGYTGGVHATNSVVANQTAEVVVHDAQTAASTIELLSGPAGMTFDPVTNTATWTPTADDITTGLATSDATFRVTNYVGSVEFTAPIRVLFSGVVQDAQATRNGYDAWVSWNPPTDNATPIAAYSITRHWTFQGSHKGSATYTVDGNTTSLAFVLGPTGDVVHTGVNIVPIDASGREGVGTNLIGYNSYQNDFAPIAVDDHYNATEDTTLTLTYADSLLANDVDTDNTPGVSPLQAQLVSGPAHGAVTITTSGLMGYTPDANFHGTDTFVYRVFDGRFYSNNATVTIDVASVNDAPTALDDYYFAASDTALNVDAATGVIANDSDADGDALSVVLVAGPANGSVTLNADGSFNYIPNAGFVGIDAFTYTAGDGLADSRVATVSVEVQPPPTRFFVVDTDVESTFEYAADGTLVDSYGLHANNRGSLGAAASSDGSTVYVVNANRMVYVYDDNGGYLGRWTALDPSRVDGIATDDTDIWILDRKLDTVFHYANGASLRAGDATATDSFVLHTANKNGQGITSDGNFLWVVNNTANKDFVYKYDLSGNYVGRWQIDPANSSPTGITIDPTGASDAIWIVDNVSDSVYQYNGAAGLVSGTATADFVFALDAANTNPQGIADPASLASSQDARAAAAPLTVVKDLELEGDSGSRGRGVRPSGARAGHLRESGEQARRTGFSTSVGVEAVAASGSQRGADSHDADDDAWEASVDEMFGDWSSHDETFDLMLGR